MVVISKDPVVLEFWLDEYEQLRPSYQSEFARPITNRLRKFYRNPRIGRVVGQKSGLNFREIMAPLGLRAGHAP